MDRSPPSNPLPYLPSADGKAIGFALAAIAFVGDLVCFGILEGMNHGPPPALMMSLAIAWLTTSLGLLSVWLGLGSGPLYLRLLIAAVPGALLILFTSRGHWSIEAFAGFALFEAAVALPFGVLRLFGFALVVLHGQLLAADSPKDADELRQGQFSLRQMFGWTVAASLVASVGKFVELPAREWFTWGVLPVEFSLVCLATVCVALMPRERWLVKALIFPLCAATVLLVLGTIFMIALFVHESPPGEMLFWTSVTAIWHVALMLGAMLIYRGIDYRLTRGAVAPPLTIAENSPTPQLPISPAEPPAPCMPATPDQTVELPPAQPLG